MENVIIKINGRGDIYIDNLPNYSGFVDLNNPKIFRGIFESGEVREYKKYDNKNKKLNKLEITVGEKIIYSGESDINLYAYITNNEKYNELYITEEYIIGNIIKCYCNKEEKAKYNFNEIKTWFKNETLTIPFQNLMIKGTCNYKLKINKGCELKNFFLTDTIVENGVIQGYTLRKKINNNFTYEYSGDVNENYNSIWQGCDSTVVFLIKMYV
ncbi:hypothetical protein [Clostridium psychrophilum]|uniref:hypothetical protein n=1 Tax=Clostridium psychrophilum TaxID=132926 RepID=UPI001C0CEA0E|nr:hypothetical protein [Clostridium psychrophilum]MBU3182878.1 hypothetical protein [Clostridium psychrophilum]